MVFIFLHLVLQLNPRSGPGTFKKCFLMNNLIKHSKKTKISDPTFAVVDKYIVRTDLSPYCDTFLKKNPLIITNLRGSERLKRARNWVAQNEAALNRGYKSLSRGYLKMNLKKDINIEGAIIDHTFSDLVMVDGSRINLNVNGPYKNWEYDTKTLFWIFWNIQAFLLHNRDSKFIHFWFNAYPIFKQLYVLLIQYIGVTTESSKRKYTLEWCDWHHTENKLWVKERDRKLETGEYVFMDDGRVIQYWQVEGYYERKAARRMSYHLTPTCNTPPSSDDESESASEDTENDIVTTNISAQ